MSLLEGAVEDVAQAEADDIEECAVGCWNEALELDDDPRRTRHLKSHTRILSCFVGDIRGGAARLCP